MRLFLLRALISWWAIPICVPIIFSILYLFCGDFNQSIEDAIEFADFLWNGA